MLQTVKWRHDELFAAVSRIPERGYLILNWSFIYLERIHHVSNNNPFFLRLLYWIVSIFTVLLKRLTVNWCICWCTLSAPNSFPTQITWITWLWIIWRPSLDIRYHIWDIWMIFLIELLFAAYCYLPIRCR